MIKYIKEKLSDKKEIKELKVKILQLEKEAGDPKTPLQHLRKEDIKWYKYQGLTPPKIKEYYYKAQAILDNPIFQNEVNKYLDDNMEFISMKSGSHEETVGIRMSMNALLTFKERLEDIENPEKPEPTKDNIHSSI